jgi:hypothetical protein
LIEEPRFVDMFIIDYKLHPRDLKVGKVRETDN